MRQQRCFKVTVRTCIGGQFVMYQTPSFQQKADALDGVVYVIADSFEAVAREIYNESIISIECIGIGYAKPINSSYRMEQE